jgi:hypothetical protein
MRLFSAALLLCSVLTISACNTPGCLVQDKAAEVSANFVASVLECSKVADLKRAINDDILSHSGLCKAAGEGMPQGTLADTFCPTIAGAVVDFVKDQGQGFLDKYGCKANAATTLSKEKLTSLCKLIPLEPKQ